MRFCYRQLVGAMLVSIAWLCLPMLWASVWGRGDIKGWYHQGGCFEGCSAH